MAKMMKCGHAANGVTMPDKKPCCVICAGLTPLALQVEDEPNLKGRFAYCSYGRHAKRASSTDLAFFRHWPDREYDEYYCGCWGWD